MPLPPRQAATIDAIKAYTQEHGFPPSGRDLAAVLGITQTAAIGHVRALARKGLVRFTPRTPRSIVVL